MRKSFLIAGILAMIFASCQQKHVEVKSETFTNKTEEYPIAIKHATFSSTDEEVNQACEAVNQAVRTYVQKLESQFKEEATRLRQQLAAEEQTQPTGRCELQVVDSVFMATSQYISMRLTIYSYNGGAHGQTEYMAFNYDVRNGRFLTNEDIVNTSKATAVNTQLKAYFKNPKECFTEVPTLEKVSVINLTPSNLCFTFEQYVLGAYACGAAEVNVPREALKDALLIL